MIMVTGWVMTNFSTQLIKQPQGRWGCLPLISKSNSRPSTLTPFSPNSSMVCLTTGSFHPVLPRDHSKVNEPPLESFTTSVVSLNQSTIALDSSHWTSNFSSKDLPYLEIAMCCQGGHFVQGILDHKCTGPSPSWTSICNHSKNCSKVSGFSTLMSSLVTPKYAILTCSATLLSELLGEQQNSTKIPCFLFTPKSTFPTPPGTNSSNGSKTDSGGSPFWFSSLMRSSRSTS